jgi:predicted ATPase/DNA-binding SARP family transcriptional activator
VVASWRIELLGGLAVVQGDRRITRFQTQKTGALLAYLALHPGRNHSREALAEMLWPDGDPVAIRNRLNQAISSLRRQLHPPELGPGTVLVTDHHSLGINSQIISTDVEEFERLIKLAERSETEADKSKHLEAAVALYRGELLDGYYEEWVFGSRMHLADLYDKVLHQLIRSHVAMGDPDRAIEFARLRLQLDPYHEAHHVILMRLYNRAGRPKSALKQFEDLGRALLQFEDEPSEVALKYKSQAEALLNDQPVDGDLDDQFEDGASKRQFDHGSASKEIQSNLPRIVSSFVGREREIEEIRARIEDQGDRLITILGLGGFGKTRLAIEIGWLLLHRFKSRVFFVQLANSNDRDQIVNELIKVLIPESTDVPNPRQAIIDRLNDSGESLLILDNLEHIAESAAADQVAELLANVPELRIMATSRLPLNLEGEVQFSLAPLPVPDLDSTDLKALASNPTIALFVDRAQSVKADFQLTERTAEAIVQLGNRLEGMPLALELAASWARILTPSQMLEQIESNANHLESRRKDISPRHRTLRAAFDGSFNLLSEEHQQLLLRLTVFRGGWNLEAAQSVAPDLDVLSGLQALEESSLIQSIPTDNSIRFGMLETVRTLTASMIDPAVKAHAEQLHANHFCSLASKELRIGELIAAIGADYLNFIGALSWLDEHAEPERFAELAWTVSRYWEFRGLMADGREWLQKAVAKDATSKGAKAKLNYAIASLDWFDGNFEHAWERMSDASKVFQDLDLKPELLRARFVLQLEAHRVGDYEKAKRLLTENLQLAQDLGDLGSEARCWMALGNVAIEEEQFTAAQDNYERSLEVARRSGEPGRIAPALANLANLAVIRGQFDAAKTWIEEATNLVRYSSHRWLIAMNLIIKGRLENEIGEHRDAAATLITAVREAPVEKLVFWRFLFQFGFALNGLGFKKEAIRLFGYGESYRDRIGEKHRGFEMRQYETRLALIRDLADPREFSEQFEIGRNMGRDDLESIISKVQRSF